MSLSPRQAVIKAFSLATRRVVALSFAGILLGSGLYAALPHEAVAQSCMEKCFASCQDLNCAQTCESECSTKNPNENTDNNPNGNTSVTQLDLFNPLGDMGLTDLLDTILQGLIWLSIPIVTIMVIIGAYYMITGGGDPGKVKKGKDYVIWAAIGFGVLLLASSVTSIITNFLTTE